MVSDLKEVFMMFDKDEDGVLIFEEIEIVMKLLGQRPTGNNVRYKGTRDLDAKPRML